MTRHDELRARLAAIDPARQDGDLRSVSEPSPTELRERIMQTIDQAPSDPAAPDTRAAGGGSRARLLAAAAVLVLAAAGVAGILATTGGDPAPRSGRPTTVALQVPAGDAASSCVQFDVAFLRNMPVAFAGTVTSIEKDTVTLDVDHWYRGGSADRATVSISDTQTSVALDGVDFVDGRRYLLTATDGTVNGCGFSGPASAELEDAFAQAFGD